MQVSMTAMQKARSVLLVIGLLCLTCLVLGTFSVEIYGGWLKNHEIHLVNYVAEVGRDVDILSPITPEPIGMQWFSLNFDGELRRPVGREVDRLGPNKSEKFLETYNTSWQSVFVFDELNRWLKIRKVRLGYADLFRVFIGQNRTGETKEENSTEGQAFDVAITFVTFEKHECGFASKPQNPKKNDTLILSCNVIVNGMWNAYLTFRNEYDDTDISGETKTCGVPRKLGSKICNSITIKAYADILSYSCQLKFHSTKKHAPKNPIFRNSKWTSAFNRDVVCNLPKIYLQVVPSDVSLLCNNMPCGESVAVGDTVTCVAHGYPQPVFDLRIRNVSPETGNKSWSHGVGYENRFFMDTDETEKDDHSDGNNTEYATGMEIKGSEDFRIGPLNVGLMEVYCNVSNALGWGYNSLALEVKLKHGEGRHMDVALGRVEAAAAAGTSFMSGPSLDDESTRVHNIALTINKNPFNYYVRVGDVLAISVWQNSHPNTVFTGLRMWLSDIALENQNLVDSTMSYRFTVTDIGAHKLRIYVECMYAKEFFDRLCCVVAECFGDYNILCNNWPCTDNGIMKVGDKIKVYVDQRKKPINWYASIEMPYTLQEKDLGTMLLNITVNYVGHSATMKRTIFVLPDSVVGVDILCNDKFCEDGETMKFGDQLSCYFEPKFMIGRMNFTLLIDNYVKVEGYPCTYTLREEDVGTKVVQCKANSNTGTFERTRSISVACEFRDALVVRRAMNDSRYTRYEVKFNKTNVTHYPGVIILCGDEPCDKPGRTIYTRTYVICRMNDGSNAEINFKVNGRFISSLLPVVRPAEVVYKLQSTDVYNKTTKQRIGPITAKCSYRDTPATFSRDVTINFTVHEWPCKPDVVPASADAFDVMPASTDMFEHGDAAGEIDLDQAENILLDSGPDSGSRSNDTPKRNEGTCIAEVGKTAPNFARGRESFVLLQVFLAFVAAFVGLFKF